MTLAVYSGVGEQVCRFAERYIRQTKGRWAGQPLTLEKWQRELLDELYLVDEDGNFVYREALIGVPRKNGKSTLTAALALYGLTASNEPGAEVYAAAASKDQARIVFDQARAFVEGSPALQDWLKPMRSVIACQANGGVFRVLSSDAPLQHGLNPSLVVIDELHAHKDPELYYALTTGQLARENPLVVSITTAGFDQQSICWQVYEHGKALETAGIDEMRSERFLFRWFEAPKDAEIDDFEAWRAANPSSWIDIDDLKREQRRLPEHVFRRLHLNQWTASEEAWLPVGAWDACFDATATIPTGEKIVLGVDIGTKRDTSAVVRLWERADGKIVPEAAVFAPKQEGTAVELAAVDAEIARCASEYKVEAVVYDKWAFERSAQDLLDRGLLAVEMPMSVERMTIASQEMYEAIVTEKIAHNGEKVLSAHVAAGATKIHDRGWRLVKNKATQPIDALMAMTIAYSHISKPGSVYDERGILVL